MLKLYTKFKLLRISFIMMVIQIVVLLAIILMTIHASSLTQADIEESEVVMLYDDMGYIPRCVFTLGFYRETLVANERWGGDSVAIQPLTESNLSTAFNSDRLVYIAGHGAEGFILLIDGDIYWPKDIQRKELGDKLQYIYISCCDSGILHDEWQNSLEPAEVKTFDRLSLVIEHAYWLIVDGPKIINELE
ncbi:hypothetical protein [Clostridium sp.]|uniref:hypothetical protein n=1 Tax=Clostridium sp. TaxID=1506 RepID=UPI003D6D29CD